MNRLTISGLSHWLILFCLIVFGNVSAQPLVDVASDGITRLSITLSNGKNVVVVLQQTKLSESFPYKHGMLWGADDMRLPQSILTLIDVQIGKDQVFIPVSAYSDLGEVKSVSLNTITHGFCLQLHGGDTAASYDAMLTFKYDYLHSKKVTLREFPRQRWESTAYSFTKE